MPSRNVPDDQPETQDSFEQKPQTRENLPENEAAHWRTIERLAYLGAVVLILILWLFYVSIFQIGQSGDANKELLLSVVPNIVAVLLVFAITYVFFRNIQANRVERDRRILAADVTRQTVEALRHELRDMQSEREQQQDDEERGRRFRTLGILHATPYWTEYTNPGPSNSSEWANRIQQRLHKLQRGATCYVLTVSPSGIHPMFSTLQDAVEDRGITVKWAYYTPGSLKHEGVRLAVEMLYAVVPDWRNRTKADGLAYVRYWSNLLRTDIERSNDRIADLERRTGYRKGGTWHLYESYIPHPYFALIAVEGEHITSERGRLVLQRKAPANTFGFLQLYTMFQPEPESYSMAAGMSEPSIARNIGSASESFKSRAGLYLEDGEILDYYYWSTIQLFMDGDKDQTDESKRGYLALIPTG